MPFSFVSTESFSSNHFTKCFITPRLASCTPGFTLVQCKPGFVATLETWAGVLSFWEQGPTAKHLRNTPDAPRLRGGGAFQSALQTGPATQKAKSIHPSMFCRWQQILVFKGTHIQTGAQGVIRRLPPLNLRRWADLTVVKAVRFFGMAAAFLFFLPCSRVHLGFVSLAFRGILSDSLSLFFFRMPRFGLCWSHVGSDAFT